MKYFLNYRLRAALLISTRGIWATLNGLGIYVVANICCLVGVILTNVYLEALEENGYLIITNPLLIPFNIIIIIIATYLAFSASISISRERELGTLEVLFYAPVDAWSFVVAKFIEEMSIFMVLLILCSLVFGFLGLITNFGFFKEIIWLAILYIPMVSCFVSFGILLSTLTKRIKTSTILLTATVCLFLGVYWGGSALSNLSSEETSPVLSYVKALLVALTMVLRYISPLGYLDKGMEALAIRSFLSYIENLLASALYSLLLLVCSSLLLIKKGVRG